MTSLSGVGREPGNFCFDYSVNRQSYIWVIVRIMVVQEVLPRQMWLFRVLWAERLTDRKWNEVKVWTRWHHLSHVTNIL